MRIRFRPMVLALAVGCSEPPPGERALGALFGPAPGPPPADLARHTATQPKPAPEKPEQAAARCAEQIQDVLGAAALPGAPELEARRADVLWRAKAEPVVFVRAPSAAADNSTEARILRAQLERGPAYAFGLAEAYKSLHRRPALAREVLLRDGYLYSESPHVASALVQVVELHLLFGDEPELVIERGSVRLAAIRARHFYEYADGPERGKRARLLLFDRVWAKGTEPGAPLHRDLRALASRAGFDRVEIERITERAIVARLRYGGVVSRALLRTHGARVELACEVAAKGEAERLSESRELALRRRAVLSAQRRAIVQQVEEALPFDEPRTEDGQQDGNLRPAWKWAYGHGWDTFDFNEDPYSVFDRFGRPLVPQVCIDFVTDTLERASGTWWRERGPERKRVQGGLDFDQLDIGNRRSVEVFVDFAARHPEWFDVYPLAPDERIPLIQKERFFSHLFAFRDRYLPGDIVSIHGLRDDGEMHYHSFFVYDADPVSGIPMLVAANSGRPRVRSWESEMRSAPLRSIHTRVRPRLDWLETLTSQREGLSVLEPAPLISAAPG